MRVIFCQFFTFSQKFIYFLKKSIEDLKLSDDLINFEGLNNTILVKLGNANIKKLDDLADLASDELKEILDEIKISNKDIDDIIMRARSSWFED